MHTHIPRKRFGQHFLHDQNVIQKIVTFLHPQVGENLVEIGGGLGALTSEVIKKANFLQVIEIDKDLVEKLQTRYSPTQLKIYSANALRFNFASLNKSEAKLRIFGNLPYNISTPLLFHLLSFSPLIQDMVFMLQKEVVMRLCATPLQRAEYGRLSLMLQYACQVKWLFDIQPSAFSPPPKVVSSLVQLIPYEKRPLQANNEALFNQVVNVAFQQRRKTLKKSLQQFPHHIFTKANIDCSRRPETLSLSEFIALSNAITEVS